VSIRVLFFGVLRDIVGLREDRLEVPEGGRLAWVFEHYAARFPRLQEMSASIVLARNQHFAAVSDAVSEGDEIAFLPPVSGGLGQFTQQITDEAGNFFALTRDPIDSADLRRRLLRGPDGAVVLFEGVARNNTKGRPTRYLEYECYQAMAVKMMAQIGAELAGRLPVSRIGMIHRLGRIEIGEASVVVAVAAPHRQPAFEAALDGINRLKRLVPVWKKEYFADGEVWVEGQWDDSVSPAGA
jgi:molybdopterin synthase catalytic subunit